MRYLNAKDLESSSVHVTAKQKIVPGGVRPRNGNTIWGGSIYNLVLPGDLLIK